MSFAYFRDVLPSGLRVVTVEAPHLHTAVVAAYVRVGSRHETPKTNGVSHFLEHLFFRGSEDYPDTVQMNAAVEEVGGNLNGVTTRDHGYYYTPLHPDHLEVGLRILGDMLTRPRLVDLEVERQVILEEMLDEVDERGRDIDLDNVSKMLLFKGNPLSLKIAGTKESVGGIKQAQVEEHFARFYRASNMVVAAAGKVSRAQVLELAERTFRGLPLGGEPPLEEPPPHGLRKGPLFHHILHSEAQTELRMSFPTVPEQHPDFVSLQLLRRVLDDGLSSRLPFQVVERRGLAYSVHASLETYHDVGLFEVDVASAPEKLTQVGEEILRVLGELCETGPSEEELRRAKRRNRIFLDFAQDSPAELASWFGATELFRIPESFSSRAEAADAKSVGELVRVAREYLCLKNLVVTAVGPKRGISALKTALEKSTALPPG